MTVSSALIGKAGELLVAAELMRRGVEVAHPASDVGVDLLAYRLIAGSAVPPKFVPIQVKAHSGTGFNFQKSWFHRAPGIVLVQVWHITDAPQFFIFRNLDDVGTVLGEHANTESWRVAGGYSVTRPSEKHLSAMAAYRDRWHWITDKISN